MRPTETDGRAAQGTGNPTQPRPAYITVSRIFVPIGFWAIDAAVIAFVNRSAIRWWTLNCEAQRGRYGLTVGSVRA